MVTLKDVANLAQVSPSTVSIVMNGKSSARKISAATQQKVLSAAQQLGYVPNVQAQVLRGGISTRAIITLFWATDIRLHMLSRFITGIQSVLQQSGYPCELQVKPYENDHLFEALTERTMRNCNGIILCNASEKDMDFLEQLDSPVPIVLYNRYSKRYSTVNMDDATIGRLPAQIFARHGRSRPALICSPATFNGMNIRTGVFTSCVLEAGMAPPAVIETTDSMKGGYDSAKKIAALDPMPDCLFCTSDRLALGALKGFHECGVRIPRQLEIIAVGSGDQDQQEYAIPSLSVIRLPMEQMAAACLKRMLLHFDEFGQEIDSLTLPIEYIARESCPE